MEKYASLEKSMDKLARYIPDTKSLEAEINIMKQKVTELATQWIETKNEMSTFMTDVKNKLIESVQLEPLINKIDEVKEVCTSNFTQVQQIEKESKMLNIIITSFMPHHQIPQGLCEFAYNEMGGVELSENDIADIYLLAETMEKVVHLVKFWNQHIRNAFFKGKIQLSPRARVWINEDLNKIKESIAYVCRLRYKGGKLLRC